MSNHRADILKLARQVHALSDAFVGVGKVNDLRELIRILRTPGWTTPAEIVFARGIVETMIAQTKALSVLRTALLRGSRAVR